MDSSDNSSYNFDMKERGIALLIHNENFKDKSHKRNGDTVDHKRMKKVFKSLGFKICSLRDQTAEQMRNKAKDIAKKKCHKNSDCFVCVIASHGQEEQTGTSLHDSYLTREQHIMGGVKYDTNHTQTKTTNLEKDLVKTSELIDIFSNDNCEGLRGKPKLFFIQACRVSGICKMDEGWFLNPAGNNNLRQNRFGNEEADASAICDNKLFEDKYEEIDTSDTDDDDDFLYLKETYQKTEHMHTVSSKTELQLCQSEEKQNEETDAKATLTDDQLSNVPMITLIPCPEDTLIMFSAQSGNFAVRSSATGGWMLNELYLCLKDANKLERTNFVEVLTEVLAGMSKRTFQPSGGGTLKDQFSPGTFIHCLNKEVFFKKKSSRRRIKQMISGFFRNK